MPPPSIQCLVVSDPGGERVLTYLPSASSFKGGSSPEEVIVKNKDLIS